MADAAPADRGGFRGGFGSRGGKPTMWLIVRATALRTWCYSGKIFTIVAPIADLGKDVHLDLFIAYPI